MKMTIDTNMKTLTLEDENQEQHRIIELYTPEAFNIISNEWVKVGWNQKYSYTFTWLGLPVIQLPEDMIRMQEVIFQVQPDVIIETGIAHGGSLIYYASLCKILGRGRVIGVDIEIRPWNQKAIEKHALFPFITLVEGDSTAPEVVNNVKSLINNDETVLVLLDSCHTKQHVFRELEAYHRLVTPGSYIVATDGIMRDLCDVPRGRPEWQWDNPATAAADFVTAHPEFRLEQPQWPFNESALSTNVTHWPGAWLRRQA